MSAGYFLLEKECVACLFEANEQEMFVAFDLDAVCPLCHYSCV